VVSDCSGFGLGLSYKGISGVKDVPSYKWLLWPHRTCEGGVFLLQIRLLCHDKCFELIKRYG
jgi:hypothetical protein